MGEESKQQNNRCVGRFHFRSLFLRTFVDYCSAVSFKDPDYAERWPKVAQACFVDTVLCPGDALFIPRHCWHLITSISREEALIWAKQDNFRKYGTAEEVRYECDEGHSVSVSVWWGDRIER